MKHILALLTIVFIAYSSALQAQTKKKKTKTTAKKVEQKKVTSSTPSAATTPAPLPANNTPTQNNTARKSKAKSTNDDSDNDRLGLNLGNGSKIKKGTTVLDIGVGLNYYGIPVHGGFEKLVADNISVGGYFNYLNYNDVGFISSGYSYHLIYAGVKGNYYFNELLGYGSKKYHLYAGLNIGYVKLITADNSFTGYNSRPFLGGQVGVRYFFNQKFGVFAEGDYSGQGGATIGLAIKLK
jgi:outer membrane immunogenic protein